MPGEEFQHLILGGSIKAATSSLFNYLNAHPLICGSKVKETWFFSMHYSGDIEIDRNRYAAYFSPAAEHRILFEASPEYLSYRENVAPRIKRLLPDARLLFVLRDPVDRLYSHFNFAKGKFHLPRDMSFEFFVEQCQRFGNAEITVAESGIAIQHLRALEIGNYGRFLKNFYEQFAADQIKVIFFEDLKHQPLEVLEEICAFIGVSPSFYDGFVMHKANVTFSARLRYLHRLVLTFNRWFEPLLLRHPALKRRLLYVYKSLNQDREGYAPMHEETREKLAAYYAPGNDKLKQLLGGQKMPSWAD